MLIERLPGMEDSSRYWSVSMTMEHLITVGDEMASIISDLGSGRVPQSTATVASVKPKGTFRGDPGDGPFREFLARFSQKMGQVKDRSSPLRFPHPWWGPLDLAQWLGVGALHQQLHRRQIVRIVRGRRRGMQR